MLQSWRDILPRATEFNCDCCRHASPSCSGHVSWVTSSPAELRAVTLGFVKQSVLKQFLTEGER